MKKIWLLFAVSLFLLSLVSAVNSNVVSRDAFSNTYKISSDQFQTEFFANPINMRDGFGVYKPYEEVTSFKQAGRNLMIQWNGKKVILQMFIKDKNGVDRNLEGLSQGDYNKLKLTTNITQELGKYRWANYLTSNLLDQPLELGFRILPTKVDCNVDGYSIVCGEQRIDFSEAVNLQGLNVTLNNANKEVRIRGDDLSFVDPTISIFSGGGGQSVHTAPNYNYVGGSNGWGQKSSAGCSGAICWNAGDNERTYGRWDLSSIGHPINVTSVILNLTIAPLSGGSANNGITTNIKKVSRYDNGVSTQDFYDDLGDGTLYNSYTYNSGTATVIVSLNLGVQAQIDLLNETTNSSFFGVGITAPGNEGRGDCANPGTVYCSFFGLYGSSTKLIITYISNDFNINSETYNPSAVTGTSQSFSINVTYDSAQFIVFSGDLVYNGTIYPGTVSGSGDNRRVDRTILVPQQNGTYPFYWNFSLTNSTGTFYQNSTTHNQVVTELTLAECNATYTIPVLNFTANREDNLTRINPFLFQGTFMYNNKTFSINENSIASVGICANDQSVNVSIDATIAYDGIPIGTYVQREYSIDDLIVTNATQNISLLLLPAVDATPFNLLVQDASLVPIPNAFIEVQRYYPGTNTYQTVQIVETGSDGTGVAFYVLNTIDYRHIIKKGGVILLQTQKEKMYCTTNPCSKTFTIGQSTAIPGQQTLEIDNLTSTLTFNSFTNIITFSYLDSTGNLVSSDLNIIQLSISGDDNQVCDVPGTGSPFPQSGVLTCDMTGNTGTFIAYGYITRNGESQRVAQIIVFDIVNPQKVDRGNLFLAWFIILTAGLAFIWNPTALIISVNMAIIFVNMMGLATFGSLFLFSMVGVSLILLWIMKT